MLELLKNFLHSRPIIFISFFSLLPMVMYPILPIVPSDSMWNIPVAISLVDEGNINVNEFCDDTPYQALCQKEDVPNAIRYRQSLYNYFPIGISLLVLPIVTMFRWFGMYQIHILEWFSVWSLLLLQVLLLFRFLIRQNKHLAQSALLVFIFLFATTNLYIMRNMLWTHGGVELMLIFALLLLDRAKVNPWLSSLAALPLAFSYLIRPTSIIFFFLFGLYIALYHQRQVYLYILMGFGCLSLLFLNNYLVYGALLSPYYSAARLDSSLFNIALIGQLFSPSRGLFIFTPIFLFSLYGFHLAWLKKNYLLGFCGLSIVAYTCVLAFFPHWWGGHSYGPRFFTDIIPFFVVLLVPVLQKIQESKKKFLTYIFIVATIFSVFTAVQPFVNRAVWNWNIHPTNIDTHPERLWDWKDMQMFRF